MSHKSIFFLRSKKLNFEKTQRLCCITSATNVNSLATLLGAWCQYWLANKVLSGNRWVQRCCSADLGYNQCLFERLVFLWSPTSLTIFTSDP